MSSVDGKDKACDTNSLNIPEVLADFFLKKFDMSSNSDESDDEYHQKRKKSKHKKRKHKKKKYKHRSKSRSCSSEKKINKVKETSSSEEKDIKRLKKIKKEVKDSNTACVSSSSLQQSNDSCIGSTSSPSNENFTHGPSVEISLSSMKSNNINTENSVILNANIENDGIKMEDFREQSASNDKCSIPCSTTELKEKNISHEINITPEQKVVSSRNVSSSLNSETENMGEVEVNQRKIEGNEGKQNIIQEDSNNKKNLKSNSNSRSNSRSRSHSRSSSRASSNLKSKSPGSSHIEDTSVKSKKYSKHRSRRCSSSASESYSHSHSRSCSRSRQHSDSLSPPSSHIEKSKQKSKKHSKSKYSKRKTKSHSYSRSRSRSKSKRDSRSPSKVTHYSSHVLSSEDEKEMPKARKCHDKKSYSSCTSQSKISSGSSYYYSQHKRSRSRSQDSFSTRKYRKRSVSKSRSTSSSDVQRTSHSRSRSRSKSRDYYKTSSSRKYRSGRHAKSYRHSSSRSRRHSESDHRHQRKDVHSESKSRSRTRSRSRTKSHTEMTNSSEVCKKQQDSNSVEQESDSKKIDQAKILELARKNVLSMIQKGTLPEGLSLDSFRKEHLMSLKAGGKSVQELTDFCIKISKDEIDINSEFKEGHEEENQDSGFIHHPFKLKEQSVIKLNIKNAVQIPVKTHAEKVAETARLSSQFPVSSGNQHKQKELEWIPVEPNKTIISPKNVEVKLPTPQEVGSPVVEVERPVSSVVQDPPPPVPAAISYPFPPPLPPPVSEQPLAILPPPPSMPSHVNPVLIPAYTTQPSMISAPSSAFPMITPPAPSIFKPRKPLDVASIVTQRFKALTKLQENPNDQEALQTLQHAQESIQEWVQSQQVPGLFTGSTDAKLLSVEELCGPRHYRVKKDIFMRAAPVTEGKGMSLLKKMGWNPGEGLGKNKEGSLEPLVLDIKTDKKGLVSEGEGAKRNVSSLLTKDLQGKHPVSALMELCSKRKWKPPLYTVIKDVGPPHKKLFLFKVEVNGIEYQPITPCSNKKQAKADAAVICLQALNVFSKIE